MDHHQNVSAKAEELKNALAKQTGVKAEDVGKVLDKLGLQESLNRRAEVEAQAQANPKFKAGLIPLHSVTLDNLRVATGAVPQ